MRQQHISLRPPLANELFLDGPIFSDARSRFPACHPIIPYLQRVPAGSTLERRHAIIQSETTTDRKRHEQLAAIHYYLDRIRAAGLAVGATFASGGLTESVSSRGAEEFCQAES